MSSANSLFSTTGTLGGLNVNAGSRTNTRHISAATTLSGGDSGKLLSISQSSVYTITLPDPTTNAGDSFHFIDAATGSNIVTISSNAANVIGSTNTNANAVGAIDNGVTALQHSTFNGANANLGDTLNFISNGTNYILTGNSVLTNGFGSS